MTNLNDIGKEQQPGRQLSEEQLLAYMEGRLSGDALHEVEAWLATEGMEGDALEGLQDIAPDDVKVLTGRLNRQLHQSLEPKKRRRRRGLLPAKWTLIAIALILLLAALGFAVVWLARQP